MTDLLDVVLQAHGGIERWNTFQEVKGTFVSGGGLFPRKSIEVDARPLDCTVTIHEESTLITPYAIGVCDSLLNVCNRNVRRYIG